MRTLYKGPLAVGVTRCVSTPARPCDLKNRFSRWRTHPAAGPPAPGKIGGMTQTPPSSYLASRLAQASGQPLPNGEALAAFTRRDDALAAFDVLSAAGFPVTALYLVNEGVKQVEYPLQRSYGRMLLSSLMWGIIAGLGCAALTIGDGSDFLGRAASTVPLSVAIFMVWTLVSIRRGGNSRYPMRGEAIPERTTMYALSEYAGQARMILRDTPGFAQAMRSVHGAAYGGGNATQQPGTTGTAAPRTGSTPPPGRYGRHRSGHRV